jgi:hypothetical protein
MTKASTELGQREIRTAASLSPGKPRRGRPTIPIAAEDLLEMAALVFDASHGTRGHYSAASQIIARRYPEANQEAHQARRKLMVRRFLDRKVQLLAEVKTRRKPTQQPVCVSTTLRAALTSLHQATSQSRRELELRPAPISDLSRLAFNHANTREVDRLARDLGHLLGPPSYGDDPGLSIMANAVRRMQNPLHASLISGRSIADGVALSHPDALTPRFAEARRLWEASDRARHDSWPFDAWTKFR